MEQMLKKAFIYTKNPFSFTWILEPGLLLNKKPQLRLDRGSQLPVVTVTELKQNFVIHTFYQTPNIQRNTNSRFYTDVAIVLNVILMFIRFAGPQKIDYSKVFNSIFLSGSLYDDVFFLNYCK